MCVLACYLCIIRGTEIHSHKQRQAGANKSLSFTPMGSTAFVYQPPLKVWVWKKRSFLNLCSVHTSKSGMRRRKSGYQSCCAICINRRSTWPFSFFHSSVSLCWCRRFEAGWYRLIRYRLIRLNKHLLHRCDLKPRALHSYWVWKWKTENIKYIEKTASLEWYILHSRGWLNKSWCCPSKNFVFHYYTGMFLESSYNIEGKCILRIEY